MRALAVGSLAPIHEGRAHAIRLRADAVERMVGHEEDAGAIVDLEQALAKAFE